MNQSAILHPATAVRAAAIFRAACCCLGIAGCGNGHAELPPESVSRTALEGALKTWREGGKPGTLAGIEPEVQVFDTPWSQGDRLGTYEILSEDATSAERRFNVRLSLAKPNRVEEVQYYVIGQKPVMIFRDQDYERNINMEDGPKMKTAKTRRAPGRK